MRKSMMWVLAPTLGMAGWASGGSCDVFGLTGVSQAVVPQEGTTAAVKAPVTGTLEIGDLLDVSVYTAPTQQPEFAVHVRVGAEGTIRMPIVGSVKVAGDSVERAETGIAQLYATQGILRDCQVTIVAVEYGVGHSVSVSGEVQKPGVYPINGPMKVVDAIALAGGVTPRAGMHVVVEHSNGDKDTLDRTSAGGFKDGGDVSVQGGDKVQVERAGVVYVVGDVNKPGGFVMEDSGTVSVLQAVALAGGTTQTAALNDSKVIRTTPEGRVEIPIRLKDILRSKEHDLAMLSNDILFIPVSGGKAVAIKSVNAIVQTAVGMAIYGHF